MRNLSGIVMLLLMLPCLAFSQKTSFTVCPDCDPGGLLNTAVTYKGAVYTMSYKTKIPSMVMKVSIYRSDPEFRKVDWQTKEETELRSPVIYSLQVFNDQLYLVYQERDKKNRVEELKAAPVDIEGRKTGTPIVLSSMKASGYEVNSEETYPPDFYTWVRFSPDRKRIAVIMTSEQTAAEAYILVMDDQFRKIWDLKESFPWPSNLMSLKDAAIANDGRLFLAYRFWESRTETLNPNTLTHLAIYSNGKKTADHSLNLDNNRSETIQLQFSSDTKKLLFAGEYYKMERGNLQGVFKGELDLTENSKPAAQSWPFPAELIREFEKDGFADKKGLIYSFVHRLLVLDNGDLDLIAEGKNQIRDYNRITNISGSLLNARFTATGIQFARIPKYRASAGGSIGDSFKPVAWNNKLLLFYNDAAANLKKDIHEGTRGSDFTRNLVMSMAVIDADGQVRRETAIDQDKENLLSMPIMIRQMNTGTYIIPFYKVNITGGLTDKPRLITLKID